jgi:thiol:disulfide interchange protein
MFIPVRMEQHPPLSTILKASTRISIKGSLMVKTNNQLLPQNQIHQEQTKQNWRNAKVLNANMEEAVVDFLADWCCL